MTVFRQIMILFIVIALSATWCELSFGDEISDSATAWKRWKDISAAIALRELDGPDDIIEKAEIIDDRVDELRRENERLKKEILKRRQRLDGLLSQKDSLQGIADIKMGGDFQMRQNLSDISDRIQATTGQIEAYGNSQAELEKQINRMSKLAMSYREKARLLHIKEGGAL